MTSFKALALAALLALVNQSAAELRGFDSLITAKENVISNNKDDAESAEDILKAMKSLNKIVEGPITEESSYAAIDVGFKYVGEFIEKLHDGEIKDKFEDTFVAMYENFEEKKAAAFVEEKKEAKESAVESSEEEELSDSTEDVSAENILEAMKFLNGFVEGPEAAQSTVSEIEDGFRYVGEHIEKLQDGEIKDKFKTALVAMYKNFEEKKASFEESAVESSEEEELSDSMDDADSPENLLLAMKFLNEVVENPKVKNVSDSEIEDGFKKVGEHIEKLQDGEIKDKFETAFVAMYKNFEEKKRESVLLEEGAYEVNEEEKEELEEDESNLRK